MTKKGWYIVKQNNQPTMKIDMPLNWTYKEQLLLY